MSRLSVSVAIFVTALSLACAPTAQAGDAPFAVLKPDRFKRYVDAFNADDAAENVVNAIPNAKAGSWIAANAPLFECPDEDVQDREIHWLLAPEDFGVEGPYAEKQEESGGEAAPGTAFVRIRPLFDM